MQDSARGTWRQSGGEMYCVIRYTCSYCGINHCLSYAWWSEPLHTLRISGGEEGEGGGGREHEEGVE
jgi:hypothetical protein